MTDALIKEVESIDDLRTDDTPCLPTVTFAINEELPNDRDQENTSAVPKISQWTKLAKLHRHHILVSAASGVPYDRKVLELDEVRRKSVGLRGIDGEDSDSHRVDMGARRLSIMSGRRSAAQDDDEDDDDGAPTASSDTYIKSAIPYLPRRVAVLCLILNVIIPGTGTMLSGLSVFCCGQPRIKDKDGLYTSTLCVNLLVGVMQLFTITFLLVGWIWSLVWGIYMVLLAVEQSKTAKAKHKTELKVQTLTALNSRLRGWTLRQTR